MARMTWREMKRAQQPAQFQCPPGYVVNSVGVCERVPAIPSWKPKGVKCPPGTRWTQTQGCLPVNIACVAPPGYCPAGTRWNSTICACQPVFAAKRRRRGAFGRARR